MQTYLSESPTPVNRTVFFPVQDTRQPASCWQRLARQYPTLRILEIGIQRLHQLTPTDFWPIWTVVEEILADTFGGELRPVIGTDHDRAWNRLFVLFDDMAGRRAAA